MVSLAVKYRPKTWEDVVEQDATKSILNNQLETGEIKNAYLFCGGAGTGKTTCARIFANEINKGVGTPIELDAASNNSVDDVRKLIEQAQSASIDSEYKVFILDEVHALSNSAWQAMLKILEEPPKKSIFIMATTDPQKIPNTILSRVQRYDFKRISQKGIIDRLERILQNEYQEKFEEFAEFEGDKAVTDEQLNCITWNMESIEYIARLADGGMRDAITMLDKCLAYSYDLTIENVSKALGTADSKTMVGLTSSIVVQDIRDIVTIINDLHSQGKDLKLFVRQYTDFVLDLYKAKMLGGLQYTKLPSDDWITETLEGETPEYFDTLLDLLDELIKLVVAIKWDSSPKSVIEATLIMFSRRNNK